MDKLDSMIDETLYRFELGGDKYKMTHVQDVEEIARLCHEERKGDGNGFTLDRTMRHVGEIPLVFAMQPKYKDLLDGDQQAMAKASKLFFEDHPEFLTSRGL